MLNSIFDVLQNDALLDEAIDSFIDRATLKTEYCGLKHAPKEYNIPPVQAVEYLCQNLGYVTSGGITELIRVPICQDCVNGLHDPEWALLYCVNCHNSQWVYKIESSYVFHTDVVWLDECPHCSVRKESDE